MSAVRRRLHAGHGGEAGVSLVELLVVSLVSTVLLGALGTLVSSSLAASRETAAHTAATAEARLAMDVMARRLRVAARPPVTTATVPPVFVRASSDVVEFHASLGTPGSSAPVTASRVRYAYDTTRRCLLETVTPPSGPARSSCLAYGPVAPTFQYFQVTKPRSATNPSPTPVPTSPLVPPTGGQLSAADAERVASVQVDLAVTDPREPTRTLDVTTRVLLVNRHNERS